MLPHHNLQLSGVFRSKPSSVLGLGCIGLVWSLNNYQGKHCPMKKYSLEQPHFCLQHSLRAVVSFPLNRLLSATESSCYCGMNCDNFHPSELSIFFGAFLHIFKGFPKVSKTPSTFQCPDSTVCSAQQGRPAKWDKWEGGAVHRCWWGKMRPHTIYVPYFTNTQIQIHQMHRSCGKWNQTQSMPCITLIHKYRNTNTRTCASLLLW